MPVIPDTQEVDIGRIMVPGQPRQQQGGSQFKAVILA
jgi:hypothetical protein